LRRVAIAERPDWRATAESHGFLFHTIGGEPYWDESAYYAFTLEQIERDIEAPTAALHELAMDLVAEVVDSDALLARLAIPAPFRDWVRRSWHAGEPHLYGRMDFAYDGRGPAKLYELNYDTPTALYEAAFFQWLWLEQQLRRGALPRGSDQFNSIQEALVEALGHLAPALRKPLYFSAVRDSDEDQGTVAYLRDCAEQAGLATRAIAIEDIGLAADGRFTDLEDRVIGSLFKLYPLEYLFEDEFGRALPRAGLRLIEPAWKSVLANKGILPLLWERHRGHPNLLEARFVDDARAPLEPGWVRKPFFSREGSNIDMRLPDGRRLQSEGPDTQGPWIEQRCHPLADFDGRHPLLGSWVVADRACGLGVREDDTLITQDGSRFVPHVILPAQSAAGDDRVAAALEAFSRRG
jgi:glutathionylspermidine synthase